MSNEQWAKGNWQISNEQIATSKVQCTTNNEDLLNNQPPPTNNEQLPTNNHQRTTKLGSELLTKAMCLLSGDHEFTLMVPWPPYK